ncbi:MAG: HD family phosphohydrolase [Shinella sp.]|nr:MAG: HD family phosphohydrolase [Shinella sp.]
MKKRIRLSQVRIGMFVEELESTRRALRTGPFLVETAADVERVLQSSALSAVINTERGVDTSDGVSIWSADQRGLEATLLARFTREEIREARQSVESTMPHVRSLMGEARMNGVFAVDSANAAVEQIMAGATRNPGALLGILRLKKADQTTFLHSLAVSALMIAFGRRLGLSENELQLLGFGGLVHDLGKMLMPKEVLGKAGKLTAQEVAIMHQHPQRGHDLLRQIEGIDPVVLDICLYHHERYDGAGYPSGLAGEDIPYAARLAAICDVYEAMTTIRPYKKAWSQADTIGMMMRASGHFDPALLRSFVSTMILTGEIL